MCAGAAADSSGVQRWVVGGDACWVPGICAVEGAMSKVGRLLTVVVLQGGTV
jgi:hypothetical protein